MKSISLCISLLLFVNGIAQGSDDHNIAVSFFKLKEYDKAEMYFEKLFEKNQKDYFLYYYKTVVEQKKYDKAITISEKALKSFPNQYDFLFYLGKVYYQKKDSIQADKYWHNSVEYAKNNLREALDLTQKFEELYRWDMIEDLILLYEKKSKDSETFREKKIEVLLQQQKNDKAIEIVIGSIDAIENNYMNYVYSFQKYSENKSLMRAMEKAVYTKLSKDPNSIKWNEIAIWLSLIIEDYQYALKLSISLDKKIANDGRRVLSVAELAMNEKQYDIAIEGYDYIYKLNTNASMAELGFKRKIEALYEKVKNTANLDTANYSVIESNFNEYFSKYPISRNSATMYILYSKYLVKYRDNIDSAMIVLNEVIKFPLIDKEDKSMAKVDLGDYLLIQGEIWEASLLYGQVGNEEKDSPLGELARFKNSKIFYYNGDYELAEELLTILKSSTTELMANDALYLSVFIQENKDEGIMIEAMKRLSQSELLFYQNKVQEAFTILNSIKVDYADSKIIDDVYLLEAYQYLSKKNYELAAKSFETIMNKYPSSFIADKAIYEWAILQEEQLNQKDKAKEAFLKLLMEYKDSVYNTDARKRIRNL